MIPDAVEQVPTSFDVVFIIKNKMAALKPEVIITQAWNEIGSKFQRLTPHFRPCPTQQ